MKPFADPLRQGAILLWCAGLLVSGWMAWSAHRANQALLDERLRSATAEIVEQIQRRFGLYEYGLRGARGAVAAAGGAGLTRSQFQAYIESRDIAREFPGARGFGFVRHVPRADEAAFLEAARADGQPGLHIRELGSNDGDRFVIQHIYPDRGNENTAGLDIASETHRREAALTSARAAQARITAPITLMQARGQPGSGLLMLLPVYPTGQPPLAPDARASAVLGWVYAPLLLDDVLADLGPRAHEVNLSLAKEGDPAPFFGTAQAEEADVAIGAVRRYLNVYGQSWELSATATPALVQASRLASPIRIGLAGAGASTLLALLVYLWGQNRRARRARQREFGLLARDRRSFAPWAFARSKLALWSLLIFAAGVAALSGWWYLNQFDQHKRAAEHRLVRLADGMAQATDERRGARGKGVRFLASTPPVHGLVRAYRHGGIDPIGQTTAQQWIQHLEQVFAGYLSAAPEARNVRLIVGLGEQAREVVRLDQIDGAASARAPGELTSRHGLRHLPEVMRLPPGEVFISDIELNREHGALSVPFWPAVSYATPIFDEAGQAFGAIVVSVDARGGLDGFVQRNAADMTFYMTNARGDYLVHPDTRMTFGFEFGQPHRWADEFQAMPTGGEAADSAMQHWNSPDGPVYGARVSLPANANSDVGILNFFTTLPVASVHQAARAEVLEAWPQVLAAGLMGFAMLYLYWVSVQRSLQARSERLRLAAIVDQTTDAIIGLDTHGVVLSWNRGAQQLFGYTPAQAIGCRLDALTVPEGAPAEEIDALASLSRTSTRVPLEVWRRTREGREVEVAITLSPLMNDEGAVAGASAIVRDVTEERAAQRRVAEFNVRLERDVQERTATLRAERQRLDDILRGTDAGTWEWNLQTGEKRYNERWAGMLGYALSELGALSPDTWYRLMHPDDREVHDVALRRHLSGEVAQYECELRLRHKDGHWVWVLDRGRVTSHTADGRNEWLNGTHLDVTQAHLAQERLASSEALLDRTGRVAGVGGWQFDLETWTVAWTPLMYEIHEVDADFVLDPATPLAFYEEAGRPAVIEALRAARVEGMPFDIEVPFRTARGRRIQVRLVGEAARNPAGKVVRIVGALQDITARHAMAAEMRRINELQQSILENMPCALSAFDADLRLVAWNTEFVRLLGLEPLFENGVPGFEDIARLNAARGEYGEGPLEPKIQAMLERARHPVFHRFERVRPDGTPLEIRGTPMPGGGFVTTYTDMTERKRAEQDIARSEALLRGAIEAVDEAFVLYDPEDRLVLCNEKYRSLYEGIRDVLVPGQSFERIIRTSAERGFHVDTKDRVEEWVADRLAAHRTGNAVFVQHLTTGRVVRVIEQRLPDGHTVGFRIDITDLVRATEAAESASRAKGEFLANMSHEIRTPLHAVIGLTHMLADTPLSARQRQLLDKSIMASRSLLSIVNDVLDLAKIEAGELPLLPEPFRIDGLVAEVDGLFRQQAEAAGLAFGVEADGSLPPVLVGDALRLRQILTNLVGNAIKFTPTGSVCVSLRAIPSQGSGPLDGLRLRGEVRDTGVGVSAQAQVRLFTPFTQADASTTRQFGGTGLGLSIVRRLADMMGGTVGLNSVPGEGSTFWFELPLALPDGNGEHASEQRQAALEVLVVDDAEDDRRALVDMARAFGWRTEVCDSGEALVQWMTQRAASGQALPDAMLVDWQMGGMDGLQALAELTERIGLSHLPAALMVSASERDRLARLDTRQLASDILTKPVNASVLFNAVNHGVVARHGSSDRVMPLRPMPGQRTLWLPDVRVLLVDDSEINLEIASHLLLREGAEVVVDSSGRQALQRLEADPQAFDVVLMDVQMPDMDGLEATRRLRRNPALARLPVIALTAGALAEERRRAIDAGMNAFLTKPLEPQLLVRTVRQAIEAATARALPVRQADPPAEAAEAAALDAWPEIEGIDGARAAQRLGGDPALLHASLRRLIGEFGAWADTALPDPMSPSLRAEFAARSHKLRGAAGLIDATAVHRAAGQLEASLRDGEAADALAPRWQALGQALRGLASAAAAFLATAPAAPRAGGTQPPMDTETLERFAALLDQQDLAALALFQQHSAALCERLGAALHERLSRQMEELDFAGAAALLAQEIAR